MLRLETGPCTQCKRTGETRAADYSRLTGNIDVRSAIGIGVHGDIRNVAAEARDHLYTAGAGVRRHAVLPVRLVLESAGSTTAPVQAISD